VVVEAFINLLTTHTTITKQYFNNSTTSTCSSPTSNRKKLRFSKMELKKNCRRREVWLSFWRQFNSIHEDKELEMKINSNI
jgi:hypothetical protein